MSAEPDLPVRGKWRFIVAQGYLPWSLVVAALVSVAAHFLIPRWSLAIGVLAFVLLPLAGLYWGARLWRRAKRRYEQMSAPPWR